MELFTIEYFNKSSLCNLEKEWKRLEIGSDMTIFQSYEWNKMLVNFSIPDDTFNYESRFAVVKANNITILIAPLWIIKHSFRIVNKKGIYLLGREGWSDYLNCIYDVFNDDAMFFLLKQLSKHYNLNQFVFENIKENTCLFSFLKRKIEKLIISKGVCVSLKLPQSIQDYFLVLSKNSKQNIRTAQNRLNKDKHVIEYCFDDLNVDLQRCAVMRKKKLSHQYTKVAYIRKLKYRLMDRLRFHFGSYFPMFDYEYSKIMSAYIDGNLCAFFNYVIDDNNKAIMIIAAGTDLNYARYSPGILLMYNYILSIIKDGNYHVLDFTRGDEKYKYSLGGSSTYNCNLFFNPMS